MHRQPGGRLGFGGSAEQIETQVVSHDARQELALRVRAVVGIFDRIEAGRLDRRPGRGPQRIHSAALVGDFGDVSAFYQDGNP